MYDTRSRYNFGLRPIDPQVAPFFYYIYILLCYAGTSQIKHNTVFDTWWTTTIRNKVTKFKKTLKNGKYCFSVKQF